MIDRFDDGPVRDEGAAMVIRNPGALYTHSEVCDLLERAEELGFSLDRGSILEGMTVRELDVLVNRRQ